MTEVKELLTVSEFAEAFGWTVQRVYQLIKAQEVVVDTQYGVKLIPHSEVARLRRLHAFAEANRGRGNAGTAGHKGLRRSGRPRKVKEVE